MAGHAVVDSTARQDDFGVVTHLGGFVRQIIRVHANAVAAYQALRKGQILLGACSLQHFKGVDAQFFEN